MVSPVVLMKTEFWAKHGKNVLLMGLSGVGKTSIIRESLEHFGYKFGEDVAYYSTHSSDFVGDPTKAKVILFDDLNDPLAQKAAQEVSGLRVWKGVPVTGCVWGAYTITTKEVEVELPKLKSPVVYDTRARFSKPEKQTEFIQEKVNCPLEVQSCFEVKIEVPCRPESTYLKEQFGERIATAAIQWWDELSDEYKDLVSPRTLTQALVNYKNRGDMRDILPVNSNVSKLTNLLNTGPISEKLEELMKVNDDVATKNFLENGNNFGAALKFIPRSETLMKYFLPLLSEEKLGILMNDDDKVCNFIIENSATIPVFKDVCKKIIDVNVNVRLSKKIRRTLERKQEEMHLKEKIIQEQIKNENLDQ